jgi:hypothetical protein
MSGNATSRHPSPHHAYHWHEDRGLRLFLVALAIVLTVFLVALGLMTESAGGLGWVVPGG